jgi:integrase/recombinase XerD
MKDKGSLEGRQNTNLNAIIAYSKFLEPSVSFYEIEDKSQVISFLDTKRKNSEDHPYIGWIILKKKLIAL